MIWMKNSRLLLDDDDDLVGTPCVQLHLENQSQSRYCHLVVVIEYYSTLVMALCLVCGYDISLASVKILTRVFSLIFSLDAKHIQYQWLVLCLFFVI